MPGFSVNLDNVTTQLSKRAYRLSEVEDKIEKVAWDVVRFKNGNPEHLWQIQDSPEGAFIIALYDEEDEVKTAVATTCPWTVTAHHKNLHIFYKNEFLYKIAGSTLDVSEEEMSFFQRCIPAKLASSPELVNSLIKSLDPQKAKTLLSKYPELTQ